MFIRDRIPRLPHDWCDIHPWGLDLSLPWFGPQLADPLLRKGNVIWRRATDHDVPLGAVLRDSAGIPEVEDAAEHADESLTVWVSAPAILAFLESDLLPRVTGVVIEPDNSVQSPALPPAPYDLRRLHQCTRLRFLRANFDARLDITSIPTLHAISRICQVTPRTLREIAELPNLTDVSFWELSFQLPECPHWESVELLQASRSAIEDIAGAAPNISRLVLSSASEHKIPLEPLASLDRLRSLELSGPIESLAPLVKMPALEHLGIGDLAVDDLSPLAELPRLRSLILGNFASGPTLLPLRHCTHLERLVLPKEIEDAEAAEVLASLPNLEELLVVGCTRLQNLPRLAQPTRLKQLWIGRNTALKSVSDLESYDNLEVAQLYFPARGPCAMGQASQLQMLDTSSRVVFHGLMSSLSSLSVVVNTSSELESISKVESLQDLSVDLWSPIPLDPLTRLPQLERVALRGKCSRLWRAGPDSRLQELRFHGKALEDLSLISGHRRLRRVAFEGYPRVRDLSPLGDLPELHTAVIRSAWISDASPLQNVRVLTLHCPQGTWRRPPRASDPSCWPDEFSLLDSLRYLSSVEYLDVYPWQRYPGLDVLSGLTSLRGLSVMCFGGDGPDAPWGLEALTKLPHLRYLTLMAGDTPLDCSALGDCRELRSLNLSYCNIESLDFLRELSRLEVFSLFDPSKGLTAVDIAAIRDFVARGGQFDGNVY